MCLQTQNRCCTQGGFFDIYASTHIYDVYIFRNYLITVQYMPLLKYVWNSVARQHAHGKTARCHDTTIIYCHTAISRTSTTCSSQDTCPLLHMLATSVVIVAACGMACKEHRALHSAPSYTLHAPHAPIECGCTPLLHKMISTRHWALQGMQPRRK